MKQAQSLRGGGRALRRELQLAEMALGMESGRANPGRLKEIQAELPALGRMEAVLEAGSRGPGDRGGGRDRIQ
jgi:hypothetical protein